MKNFRIIYRLAGMLSAMGFVILPSFGQSDRLLEQYRKEAIAHEQQVKMAENEVKMANEAYRITISNMLPQVTASGDATYVQHPAQLTLPDGMGDLSGQVIQGAANYQYGAYADARQSIYHGHGQQNQKKKAMVNKAIAEDQFSLTKTEVTLATDMLYWRTVAQREVYHAMVDYRDGMREITEVVRSRVEAGNSLRNDLLMAQVRLNKAELAVVQAENNYNVTKMSLNRVLGRPLNDTTIISDSLSVKEEYDNLNEATVRAEMLIAEKQISLAEFELKIVNGKYGPKLDATMLGMYSSPGYNFAPGAVPNYRAGFTFSMPLYWGSMRKRENQLAKLEIQNAQLAYERTAELMNLQQEQQFLAWRNSLQETDLAGQSVAKAKENADLMNDQYEEGMVSVLEVVDAQLYYEDALVDFIKTKLKAKVEYTHYIRAIGLI